MADYFYVQALGQITPAQAGEAALPYLSAHGKFDPGEIAAGLVLQRLASVGIVILFATLGAAQWTEPGAVLLVIAVAFVCCCGIVLVINNVKDRTRLNNFVTRWFGNVLYGFNAAWRSIFRERQGRLLSHIILMLARFILGVASSVAIFQAFGVAVPFWHLATLTALVTLVALIPISVNGAGLTEGILAVALMNDGYDFGQVVAACFAGRLLWVFALTIWAAAYWMLQKRELNREQNSS